MSVGLANEFVLSNPNTGETKVFEYESRADLWKQHGQFNLMLRDWREGVGKWMDPNLYSILVEINEKFRDKACGPMEILSGYRTPHTNRLVGGAEASFHMKGQAADIRIPCVSVHELYRAAQEVNPNGGIGIYPDRGFIHVDTGPRRRW